MKTPDEMSNKELKEEYTEYYALIHDVNDGGGCFGTKDLLWLEMLEREISKRGGVIGTKVNVRWTGSWKRPKRA